MTTQTVAVAELSEEAQKKTLGTRAFMAPERLRRGTMNFATDVYAFAMSAYQVSCLCFSILSRRIVNLLLR
jgi:serine/threonine protein kinase